jgi:hypothetical protein
VKLFNMPVSISPSHRLSGTFIRSIPARGVEVLDSSLPFDVWTTIAGFLEILDLYSLLMTNKETYSTVDQDVI